MLSFSGWTGRIKESLAGSSLENWASFLENSPGGTINPPFPASPADVTLRELLILRALAWGCIFSLLLILGLVSACTPRTSWATSTWVCEASLTAVSHSENDLGLWMGRRLYCSLDQPCDVCGPSLGGGHFYFKFWMEDEPLPTYGT